MKALRRCHNPNDSEHTHRIVGRAARLLVPDSLRIAILDLLSVFVVATLGRSAALRALACGLLSFLISSPLFMFPSPLRARELWYFRSVSAVPRSPYMPACLRLFGRSVSCCMSALRCAPLFTLSLYAANCAFDTIVRQVARVIVRYVLSNPG